MKFYVCPVCGNIIQSTGEGTYICCGITLPELQTEDEDENHRVKTNIVDNEFYICMDHAMLKDHYISFLAYATSDGVQMVKLYPEQNVECRFARRGHGMIYAYCNQHGLFSCRI